MTTRNFLRFKTWGRHPADSEPVPVLRSALLSLALLAAPVQAAAPPQDATATGRPAEPPTEITLRPAGEPVPALKYRLVPERKDQVRGNAALFYHRAIQMLIQDRGSRAAEDQRVPGQKLIAIDEQVANWASKPLGELPREEAKELIANRFNQVLSEVDLGASRATCDWEFDQRTEGIAMLLPEIQEMRSLARLVAVKARLAILEGQTVEAMHWIETGLTMGRHVSQGPTLIQSLVGIAIDSVMSQCLLDLIQAPGTPSLYWALADRPRPFIDPRYPFEGERYLLEKELPELKDLASHVWSADEARRFADELQRKLYALSSDQATIAKGAAEDTFSFGRRLGIAAMSAKLYPEAKKSLLAQGWAEEKIKAMPVIQVACLHTILEYQKLRDDTYKWLNLPYPQSYDKIDQAMQATMANKLKNPLLTMFSLLTPALNSARMAFLRLDRQFDALQAMEAIRLYAHSHHGTLPPSLEAITEVPVPMDPATGKPFEYQVTGETATLTSPVPPGGPDHPSLKINYRLTLAK